MATVTLGSKCLNGVWHPSQCGAKASSFSFTRGYFETRNGALRGIWADSNTLKMSRVGQLDSEEKLRRWPSKAALLHARQSEDHGLLKAELAKDLAKECANIDLSIGLFSSRFNCTIKYFCIPSPLQGRTMTYYFYLFIILNYYYLFAQCLGQIGDGQWSVKQKQMCVMEPSYWSGICFLPGNLVVLKGWGVWVQVPFFSLEKTANKSFMPLPPPINFSEDWWGKECVKVQGEKEK